MTIRALALTSMLLLAGAGCAGSARRDPSSLISSGREQEARGESEKAAASYRKYLETHPDDVEVRTRLREVERSAYRGEVSAAIAREGEISASEIPSNTLAVLEFPNRSGAEQLDPLGRGLAAMMTGDFAQIERLRVVERSKLPVLMGELALAGDRGSATDAGLPSAETTEGIKTRLNRIPRPGDGAGVYFSGPLDGSVDERFDAAVRAFQKDQGLSVDGKVGPRTRGAIETAYSRSAGARGAGTPTSAGSPVDAAARPRIGKLLGAGLLVGGAITGDPSVRITLDADVTETAGGAVRGEGASASGSLKDIFRMEKEIVYALLGEIGVTPTAEERAAIGRVPTQNVDAFLAYSRGLVYEDRGQPELARGAYDRALALDPSFSMAREQRAGVAGTPEGFAALGAGIAAKGSQPGEAAAGVEPIDAIADRLRLMGGIVGSGLAPGTARNDQLMPITAPAGKVGGTGTVVVTGNAPQ